MDIRQKKQMIAKLDKHLRAGTFKCRPAYLFGHCNATEHMAGYLLSHDVHPVAILDNNKAKHGECYREIPITAPEDMVDLHNKKTVVLIANRFFDDMAKQLNELGFAGRILKIVNSGPLTPNGSAGPARAETLKKIRGRFPDQMLIVCPYNALGDVYWAMAYLPAYCGKHGILLDNIAVAAIRGGCCETARMFGAANIVSLTAKTMNELVLALEHAGDANYLVAHHDYRKADIFAAQIAKNFIRFDGYYKLVVYGLPDDAAAAVPEKTEDFDNCLNIPKGKSVIISPYAKSVAEKPAEFWEHIINIKKQRGYDVYTNVIKGEVPIRGSAGINIPVAQLISAVEYAGEFIGIRNGICDIINTANCKKTVVFPDCYYSTTSYKIKDFFALPGWHAITDADEYL